MYILEINIYNKASTDIIQKNNYELGNICIYNILFEVNKTGGSSK